MSVEVVAVRAVRTTTSLRPPSKGHGLSGPTGLSLSLPNAVHGLPGDVRQSGRPAVAGENGRYSQLGPKVTPKVLTAARKAKASVTALAKMERMAVSLILSRSLQSTTVWDSCTYAHGHAISTRVG